MIDQEKVFTLWGISKRARSHLLYSFLAAQSLVIGYLWNDGKEKDNLLQQAGAALVNATERFGKEIQNEKDARIKSEKEMREYFQKQAEMANSTNRLTRSPAKNR